MEQQTLLFSLTTAFSPVFFLFLCLSAVVHLHMVRASVNDGYFDQLHHPGHVSSVCGRDLHPT